MTLTLRKARRLTTATASERGVLAKALRPLCHCIATRFDLTMNTRIAYLARRITALERELELELAKRRAGLRFGLERGKVVFEEEIRQLHGQAQTSLLRYLRNARPLVLLSAPLIYSLIMPLLLLHACVALYQAICFPIYHIDKVRRSDYIVFDRQHLPYLNLLEKLNCAYCSYANGLIAYVGEIAARTEAYWCPIKHAHRLAHTHQHYTEFSDYGDAQAYRKVLDAFELRAKEAKTSPAKKV